MNLIAEKDIHDIIHSNIHWDILNNSSILITGANGFLPAYMVDTLMTLNTQYGFNIEVYCLVRNAEKAKLRFANYVGQSKIHYFVQDVCVPIMMKKKFDYIIHAASQASPRYYGIDPVGTLKANTIGTYQVLELARQHSVRSFLFFSSSEVYGNVDKERICESDFGYLDCNSLRSCYAESKRMGETMCTSWHKQYNVEAKVVRPFHTYGPGMSLDDGRVFADFVKSIVKREDLVLNSDGKAIRSFCYIKDAVIAFFCVLIDGKSCEAYNVGNPDTEISILDLAELLVNKIYPERNVQIRILESSFPMGYMKSLAHKTIPDISKLEKLGWRANTSLEEGFRRTIDSYIYG